MTTVFQEKVYAVCREIPAGRVTTYGEIARALGTRAYQAVGQALRRNPYAPEVPCHRVVSADGSLHGFNGRTDACELCRKRELLEAEGISVINNRIADLDRVLFRLSSRC
jgi:methylated-DNA-[protein]-cysteine S-methyltransferase